MLRFYDIDAANAALPELRETLLTLRSLRSELVGLRDRLVALNLPRIHEAHREALAGADQAGGSVALDEETRRLRLRMQAVVDQMQAAVAEIDAQGIALRDIPRGLVDFPALVAGRQVHLCWELGEDRVEWWHELATGFGGRQRLEDLH